MSDTGAPRTDTRIGDSRDRGMTLPELMIAVTVAALIAGVLATSIIVTMRQRDNTEGRLNVARAEQNVSMWMPADLASADTVNTSPWLTPCGSAMCDDIYLGDGSNVLMLEWSEAGEGDALCPPEGMHNCTVTRVSYNFYPAPDGNLYELRRVECVSADLVAWSCSQNVILRELPGPPGGVDFVPGVGMGAVECIERENDPTQTNCTRPTWVIIVSEPLDPCAGLEASELTACIGVGEPGGTIKNANRVIVSINGGGDSSGSGGGINQISITAGGTARRTISADSMTGAPSFLEAKSRCGGPLTLIIDQSGSIVNTGYGPGRVREAAIEFARLLRGTPVDIQVIEFDTTANVLGDGESVRPEPGWHEYFEMSEQDDWERLESLLAGMTFGGGTNWEDALFHTFFNPDGTTPQIVPKTVVFFTDGVPTYSRQSYRNALGMPPASPLYDGSLWQTYNPSNGRWTNGESGANYNQGAFHRAENIAMKVRAEQGGYVRIIGVGVGGINDNSQWVSNPGAGYQNAWEHAYGRYQQGTTEYRSNLDFEYASTFRTNGNYQQATSNWRSTGDFERGNGFQTNHRFQRRESGSWQNTNAATYYANNTTPDDSDGYRINGTTSWATLTEALYDAHRESSPSNFRVSSWTDATPTDYFTSQPSAPTKWRINGTRSAYNITQAVFSAYAHLEPSYFTATWTNRTVTDYYAGQPSAPGLWRINGTRGTWTTITAAQFAAYAHLNPTYFDANWADRTPTQYYSGQPAAPDNWRINGTRAWYTVTEAEFNAYHGGDTSVNWSPMTWSWVSKAVYDAGVATDPDSFRDTGTNTSLPVTTPGAEFEVVGARGTPEDHYRQVKVYPANGPYDGIQDRSVAPTSGKTILARLVAGNDTGLPYVPADAEGNDNAEEANMFVIQGNSDAAWAELTPAMRAIALGQCGGTLTLSTKTSNGQSVSAPFTYENSAVFHADGAAVEPFQPNIVTTNAHDRQKGFDYAVPGGTFITTEIRPQASSVLLRFQPLGWECRAGARVLGAADMNEQPIELVVTNPDGTTTTVLSGWSQISVRIGANEAVSCTLRVAQTS
ncbi:MAG TPA: prepilin-type N-terminal cleavage/methylation domain-containing protein [Ilumatobacter sp.]|nr:prepilin-type N-terminal cleavage/methylation domain-containing protein [Ilumatobacter sp.]